jgi:hypothetical protein
MAAVNNNEIANDQGGLNWKIFTDVPISSANLSGQNAVSRQQRADQAADSVHENSMNAAQQIAQLAAKSALQMSDNTAMLAQAMTGRVTRHILDLSAEQTVGFMQEIQAGLAKDLAAISGQLAAVQEMAKIAQTTPPQTGTGGAFGSDAGNALLQQLANIEALLRSQANRPPA